jgi:sugar (pentulose or hexulose) kinase
MNLGKLALGIDVGTSGVRIAALDAAGKLVADASAPIPPPQREGASVRQEAEIWWQATLAAFRALHGMLDLSAVTAIAVDATSGTILPIDRAGVPLAQARLYNDASAAGTALRLAAFAPKETAALGATSPLARAIELRAKPGLWKIVHQADWIAGRLSGNFAISDESNALKTGYDPVARRWPDWIAAAGLDPALLPEVFPVGSHTGLIAPQIARELQLPADTAIIAGATDGCAAFLATGAENPGDGVTSLGSTLTIKLMSWTPLFAPEFGIYSHRLGDLWLAGGASNTGGAVLAAFFPPDRIAALQPLLEPQRPTGLDYYPLLDPGERFPVSDPLLAPRLSPRPTEDHVFLQGLLEGIAAIEALGYARLNQLGATSLRNVRTVGGGAANVSWTLIRQRLLDVPLIAARELQPAVGAARLALGGVCAGPVLRRAT